MNKMFETGTSWCSLSGCVTDLHSRHPSGESGTLDSFFREVLHADNPRGAISVALVPIVDRFAALSIVAVEHPPLQKDILCCPIFARERRIHYVSSKYSIAHQHKRHYEFEFFLHAAIYQAMCPLIERLINRIIQKIEKIVMLLLNQKKKLNIFLLCTEGASKIDPLFRPLPLHHASVSFFCFQKSQRRAAHLPRPPQAVAAPRQACSGSLCSHPRRRHRSPRFMDSCSFSPNFS